MTSGVTAGVAAKTTNGWNIENTIARKRVAESAFREKLELFENMFI
jgi:hypothetical protein